MSREVDRDVPGSRSRCPENFANRTKGSLQTSRGKRQKQGGKPEPGTAPGSPEAPRHHRSPLGLVTLGKPDPVQYLLKPLARVEPGQHRLDVPGRHLVRGVFPGGFNPQAERAEISQIHKIPQGQLSGD